MQLLGYDLGCSGIIRPVEGELPRGIKPREWEAFRWWGAPFAGEKEFLHELLDAIRSAAELAPDGLPVDQFATIAALDYLAHKPKATISVGEIATLANRVLIQKGADLCLKERKVGAIMTKLGFPRRERGGDDGPYRLDFSAYTKDLLHRLVKFYGRWPVEVYNTHAPDVTCAFCREHKLFSDVEIQYYEKAEKRAEERRKRKEKAEYEKRMKRLRLNPPRVFKVEPAGGGAAKSQE
jgi:hypothetical protein